MRHDESDDHLYDQRYFLLFEYYLAEFRVTVAHSALSSLVSHGYASLLPEPFPAICCQRRTCTCRQAELAASAVRLHPPLPSSPCSPSIRCSSKERCWMYRLLNFRSVRSVQRNFFHVICTRPTRFDAIDSRPKIFHSLEWVALVVPQRNTT